MCSICKALIEASFSVLGGVFIRVALHYHFNKKTAVRRHNSPIFLPVPDGLLDYVF